MGSGIDGWMMDSRIFAYHQGDLRESCHMVSSCPMAAAARKEMGTMKHRGITLAFVCALLFTCILSLSGCLSDLLDTGGSGSGSGNSAAPASFISEDAEIMVKEGLSMGVDRIMGAGQNRSKVTLMTAISITTTR